MTAPREELARKAREWVDFADEDLRMAEHALQMREPRPYRLIAYHAQQCVEKCLKAYLVHRNTDFPYTHNIAFLLELCERTAPWGDSLEPAEGLTRFAVTTRYPGEPLAVSESQAREAVRVASDTRSIIRGALERAGLFRSGNGGVGKQEV